MTISDLIKIAGENPTPVVVYMLIIPLVSLLGYIWFSGKQVSQPGSYVFSALTHAAAVPGILAIILTAYGLLIKRSDFLEVNVIVYFLPIISMIVTFVLIHKTIPMQQVPGFDRIGGLMMMIAATFFIIFILQKIFIGVFFFGSMQMFFGLFLVLFVLIKIGWDRMKQ